MKKQLQGTIISKKMQKTIVVKVEDTKEFAKYKKIQKVHKKYMVHTEKPEDYNVGDKVIIEECRPISKKKKWSLKGLVSEGKPKAKPER